MTILDDFDDTPDLVRADVELGLSPYFTLQTFGAPGSLLPEGRLPADVGIPDEGLLLREASGRWTAHVWEAVGTNGGPAEPGASPLGLLGTVADGRDVRLRGVTVVERPPDGEPRFYRFVDWNHLTVQLGLAVTTRQVVGAEVFGPDTLLEQPDRPAHVDE